jgi:3-hydroxy acid dehydrogenase/malonic semialdehyde reductase
MPYFEKKITLIVGAHTAIGRRLAPALAKRGVRLILAGPSEASLQNASQASQVFHPLCDLEILKGSDPQEIQELVRKTSVRFSRIDLLVNCMGSPSLPGPQDPHGMPLDTFWGAEARGFVEVMQACHRLMLRQEKGQIVNVVEVPGPFMTGVVPSGMLDAILGMTKALRRQCRNTGVRVNYFSPMNLADEAGFREPIVGQFEPDIHLPLVLGALERDKPIVIEPLSAWVLWNLYRLVPEPIMEAGTQFLAEVQKLRLKDPFARSPAGR